MKEILSKDDTVRIQKPSFQRIMLYILGIAILSACAINLPTSTAAFQTSLSPTPTRSETEISFEMIEKADQNNKGVFYPGTTPRMFVIATKNAGLDLRNYFSEASQDQLQNSDYNSYYFIAVFQGYQSTGGYGVNILRIVRENNDITVQTNFLIPQPDTVTTTVITSPYELVKIRKLGDYQSACTPHIPTGNVAVTNVTPCT
ncbi:MAG TPA: protease complex subunit PrcB family protein [Anaerolineales bacterium]